MTEQPSWWTPQVRARVVDLLEADGDPHLQRVDDRTLTLRAWERTSGEDLVLTVTFVRLTYGGCGAPAGCVSETARLRGRLITGELHGLE